MRHFICPVCGKDDPQESDLPESVVMLECAEHYHLWQQPGSDSKDPRAVAPDASENGAARVSE